MRIVKAIVQAKRATTAGRQSVLAKMYRAPPDRAWWHSVGAPLERGVGFSLRKITELLSVDHDSVFVFGYSVLCVELSEFGVR